MPNKQYDLILQQGNLLHHKTPQDIGIKDEKITAIRDSIPTEHGKKHIDVSQKLVSPGFVDSHMHIDKAMLGTDGNFTSLEAAGNASARLMAKIPADRLYEDILARSKDVLHMAIKSGTTAIKTNVVLSPAWGTTAMEAMIALQKEYANQITLQTAIPWSPDYSPYLHQLAQKGKLNHLGGYPHGSPDYRVYIDEAFAFAKNYDIPIDFHVNESDLPNIDIFLYIIEKTVALGLEGSVTCGHVTALSALGLLDTLAKEAIQKAADAEIHVTTLTSCNLYLMEMGRRGPTHVRELVEAGVNVSIASDNIRDPFRPFGNADLLEEALLTAQVHKYGLPEAHEMLFDMITYNPAKNSALQNYGLYEGADADLVILDAPTPSKALLSQVARLYVLKKGKIISQK